MSGFDDNDQWLVSFLREDGRKETPKKEKEMGLDEDFFAQLESKIMAKVEKAELKPAIKPKKRLIATFGRSTKSAVRVASIMAALLLGLLTQESLIHEKSTSLGISNELIEKDPLVLAMAKAPDQWSQSLVSYRSQNDVLDEMIDSQIENFGSKDFETLMR